MTVDSLHVCLFQADIQWKNVAGNLRHYESCIETLENKPDILIFPEMYNTGFSVKTIQLAETIEGESVAFLKQIAWQYDMAVVASIALKEDNKYYNSLLWIMPDGDIHRYDKRHLFRMASEEQLFTSGSQRIVIEYKEWKFLPLVCYDLRFPLWSRNARREDMFLYDCLIYIANWPSSRMHTFDTLLAARAIENQSFAIAVNRVGEDGNGFVYFGHSQVLNPFGMSIAEAGTTEELCCVTLHKNDLEKYRSSFPVSLDWDVFV